MLKYVHGKLEVLCVFSPRQYSFNSYASSVATCWTGKTLRDSTKASGELLVQSTIWDFACHLGTYVKQTEPKLQASS